MHAIKRLNEKIRERLTVLTNLVENHPDEWQEAERIRGEIVTMVCESQWIAWQAGRDSKVAERKS